MKKKKSLSKILMMIFAFVFAGTIFVIPKSKTKANAETTYTIAYNINGGSGITPTDSKTYSEGESVAFKDGTGFSKEGYTFLGWALESDSSNKILSYEIDGADAESGVITFYAVWKDCLYSKPIALTITGVGYGANDTNLNISATDATLEISTYKIYKKLNQAPYYVASSIFSPNEYCVFVVLKGTTGNNYWFKNNSSSSYNSTVTVNGSSANVDDACGTKSYDLANATCEIVSNQYEHTYFAVWISYTLEGNSVKYEDNVSSKTIWVPTDNTKYLENAPVAVSTLSPNEDDMPHYTFKGWSLTPTGAVITTETVNMDSDGITFYAIWEADEFVITYELDGGTNSGDNPATYTVETDTITFQNPTKSGYTFEGWFENQYFKGEKITQIEKGSYGNKTIYAKWTRTHVFYYGSSVGWSYDGTYFNSGKINANIVKGDKICVSTTLSSFTISSSAVYIEFYNYTSGKNESKTLRGTSNWSDYPTITHDVVSVYVDGTNMHIYENPITIKYDLNGANEGTLPTDENKYELGDVVTLPSITGITKVGYKNLGWATTDDTTSGLADTYTALASNADDKTGVVTLYAVWQSVEYLENINITMTPLAYNLKLNNISITTGDNKLAVKGFELWYKQGDSQIKKTAVSQPGMYYVYIIIQGANDNIYFINSSDKYTGTVKINGENLSAIYSKTLAVQTWSWSLADLDDNFDFVSSTETDNVVLAIKASFDLTGHLVIYDENAGVDSVENMPIEDTSTYLTNTPITITSATPTRNGYKFLGWNTSSDATTPLTFNSNKYAMGESNLVFYAVWENLKYNKDITINITELAYNLNVTDIQITPSDTALTVVESKLYWWSVNKSLAVEKDKVENAGYYMFSLILQYKTTDYWFENESDSYKGTIMVANASSIDAKGVKSYTVGSNKITVTVGDIDTERNYLSINVTYHPSVYSVNYDDNVEDSSVSGTPAPVSTTYLNGQSCTVSTDTPTRSGYKFLGWNTDKDATTALTFNSGKYTVKSADAASGVITLYAIWKNLEYQENFAISMTELAYGVQESGLNITLSDAKLQVEGYKLWRYNKNTKSFDLTSIVSEAGSYMICLAIKGASDYQCSFINSSNVYSGTISVSAGVLTPNLLSKVAYQSCNLAKCDDTLGTISNTTTENKYLGVRVKFNVAGYAITYDDNVQFEAVSGMPEQDTNTYIKNQVVEISNATPSRMGYNFVGWNTNKNATEALSFANGNYTFGGSNVVLYSIWKEKTAISVTETAQTKVYSGLMQGFDIKGTYSEIGNFYIKYAKHTGLVHADTDWSVVVPTNVGCYDIQITRVEDETYKAFSKALESAFIISKATNEIINLKVDNVSSGAKIAPIATSKFGNIIYYYKLADDTTWYVLTDDSYPIEVGTYMLKAQVEGNDNYSEATKIVNFEILPAKSVSWIFYLVGSLGLIAVATLFFLLKRKLTFVVNDKVYDEIVLKPNTPIVLSIKLKGYRWYLDKNLTKEFTKQKMGYLSHKLYGDLKRTRKISVVQTTTVSNVDGKITIKQTTKTTKPIEKAKTDNVSKNPTTAKMTKK